MVDGFVGKSNKESLETLRFCVLGKVTVCKCELCESIVKAYCIFNFILLSVRGVILKKESSHTEIGKV